MTQYQQRLQRGDETSQAEPIRVLVVDDHPLVRMALACFFTACEHIIVKAEAANGNEALARLAEGGIDLILLDMQMPGVCGEELIGIIRSRHYKVPILVLSMHCEAATAQGALRAGAAGYLCKGRDHQLLDAVERVARGGRFMDEQLAEEIAFASLTKDTLPRHHRLSPQELRVLRLVAHGASGTDIGRELGISSSSVSKYKSQMMSKMGFSNDAEVVRYAMAHHLLN